MVFLAQQQREYARNLEKLFKTQIGLRTESWFIANQSLSDVLSKAERRSIKYVAFLSRTNELNGTLSLNLLQANNKFKCFNDVTYFVALGIIAKEEGVVLQGQFAQYQQQIPQQQQLQQFGGPMQQQFPGMRPPIAPPMVPGMMMMNPMQQQQFPGNFGMQPQANVYNNLMGGKTSEWDQRLPTTADPNQFYPNQPVPFGGVPSAGQLPTGGYPDPTQANSAMYGGNMATPNSWGGAAPSQGMPGMNVGPMGVGGVGVAGAAGGMVGSGASTGATGGAGGSGGPSFNASFDNSGNLLPPSAGGYGYPSQQPHHQQQQHQQQPQQQHPLQHQQHSMGANTGVGQSSGVGGVGSVGASASGSTGAGAGDFSALLAGASGGNSSGLMNLLSMLQGAGSTPQANPSGMGQAGSMMGAGTATGAGAGGYGAGVYQQPQQQQQRPMAPPAGPAAYQQQLQQQQQQQRKPGMMGPPGGGPPGSGGSVGYSPNHPSLQQM